MGRLRRWARRFADAFPWTGLGLLIGGASAGGLYHYAYQELDLVLLVVGYGAISLVGLSTIFVVAGFFLTKLRGKAVGEANFLLETDRWKPTGFTRSAIRWFPLVRVGWSWWVPDDAKVRTRLHLGQLAEEVQLPTRGRREGVIRRVWVEDVFGLARLGFWMKEPITLEAHPHIGKLTQLPALLSFSGGDAWPHPLGIPEGDRMELRRYAPGDPARFIHWKAFARTKKLVVRTPERALSRVQRVAAYLVAGPDDEASAGAARVAITSQALGDDWSFGADGAPDGTSDPLAALDAIVRSAEHRESGASGLEGFVRREERRGPASLVIFVPVRSGPWLSKVVAVLQARPGRSRVVVGVDGLTRPRSRGWFRRLTTRRRVVDQSSVVDLDATLRALAATRAEVVVIDRKTGRVIGEGHRRAVFERKAA